MKSHDRSHDVSLSQYNLIAGGFYDGVMLYSQALNESLSEQNLGPGPGLGLGGLRRPRKDVVTKRMWNRTFPGNAANHSAEPDVSK